MRAERRDHRNVSGVAPARYEDTTDPWLIVAGVKGEPSAPEVDFETRVEIQGRRAGRHADVAEIAVAVARGNVEATAQRDRQMGEVAAYADTLGQRVVCCARGPSFGVAEPEAPMNEVADRLHPRPPAIDAAEARPGEIREQLGLAISARAEKRQRVRRKIRYGHRLRGGVESIRASIAIKD